jgi:D-tyrosyl-tRNA(Tyr) deacylase
VRAVIQRVRKAAVRIDDTVHARIGPGLLVLVGVEEGDSSQDAETLVNKVVQLRVFEDDSGRMNRSLIEAGGAMLAVSQFTLLGDCRKGRRPSFDKAAGGEEARRLYEQFVEYARIAGVMVETGVFQAMMDVELTNSGPVTLLVDTRKKF